MASAQRPDLSQYSLTLYLVNADPSEWSATCSYLAMAWGYSPKSAWRSAASLKQALAVLKTR